LEKSTTFLPSPIVVRNFLGLKADLLFADFFGDTNGFSLLGTTVVEIMLE
jgi:hypothetical protein